MKTSLLRITAFSLLSMIVMGACIELSGVILGTTTRNSHEIGASALALPALWCCLSLLVVTVLVRALTRFELLSKAELFHWHRFAIDCRARSDWWSVLVPSSRPPYVMSYENEVFNLHVPAMRLRRLLRPRACLY